MFSFLIFFFAILLIFSEAKICTNISIPVNINARNGIFNLSEPAGPTQVTQFGQLYTRSGINYTSQILAGYDTVTGQYNISATYCVPSNVSSNTNGTSVQFLTHGIGFDKRHVWLYSHTN